MFFNEVLLREADVTAQLLLYAAAAAVLCAMHHMPAHGKHPGLQPRMASRELEAVPVFLSFIIYSSILPATVDKHLKHFRIKVIMLLEEEKGRMDVFPSCLNKSCGFVSPRSSMREGDPLESVSIRVCLLLYHKTASAVSSSLQVNFLS